MGGVRLRESRWKAARKWLSRCALGVLGAVLGGSEGAGIEAQPGLSRTLKRRAPHSTEPEPRAAFGRLQDPAHMLAVFQRELPALADGEIRVTRCSVKQSNWRKTARQGLFHAVYRVGIEARGEAERELVILGVAPRTPEVLGPVPLERLRGMRGHPWIAPFRELVADVEALGLTLLFFPLDPAMPGLAEITGKDGARILAGTLPECRAGASVERIECELAHYKPFDRAVLRIVATLRGHSASQRTVYAKLFAEDHGAECFRNHLALWSATRRATCLRLPEPLGYDAGRRMFVMSEAAGQRDLTEWIKSLERGEPLPAGVDPGRLERCALVVAGALGELQRSGVQPGSRRTFRDDLERLVKDRDLLLGEARPGRPDLVACACGLVGRLQALAPVDEPLVPAHGAFRHKQMIGDEHSLTVIDWDGITLANPALDAATFLGRLHREPLRRPRSAPELEQMARSFRDAFLELQPGAARDLDLYESLLLTDEILRDLRRLDDGEEAAQGIRCLAAATEALLDRIES